jgi:hypothetical protein
MEENNVIHLNADCPYCANPNETALPVVREVFDDTRCSDTNCNCHILGFSPECHPEADSRPFYCKIHGTLSLFCGTCNSLHATFQIAAKNLSRKRR